MGGSMTGSDVSSPIEPLVAAACQALQTGGIVLHPTATVYGFGTLLEGPGLDSLGSAKKRGAKGFVILIPEDWTTERLLGPLGSRLAERFWPGPLTLIVSDPNGYFPDTVKAEDGSAAVRVPGHPLTRALLRKLKKPITSSSVNHAGEAATSDAAQALRVASELGMAVVLLDGGTLPGGMPSTLLDVRSGEVRVVREGAVPTEEITRFLETNRDGS